MSEFKDDKGKASMMRKLTWLIVIVSLIWGSSELTYSWFNNDYKIHETFILTTLGMGIGGKAWQKIIELRK